MATDSDVLEHWKNQGEATVVVKKRGEYGIEQDEVIRGGKPLHITRADRRMNQERAAAENLDVFTNGMLAPIRVGDSAAEFAQNSNLLTEDDMRGLVRAHPKTFDKKLTEISNPIVVARLLQIAREEDCTIKRVENIEARLEEVNPVRTTKIKSTAPAEASGAAFPVVRT